MRVWVGRGAVGGDLPCAGGRQQLPAAGRAVLARAPWACLSARGPASSSSRSSAAKDNASPEEER